MRNKKPEIILADKQLQKSCLSLAALYVLLWLWLEPFNRFLSDADAIG